jgi:hypothetical protein
MLATSPVKSWHCGTASTGYLKEGTSALPSSPGDEVEIATVSAFIVAAQTHVTGQLQSR